MSSHHIVREKQEPALLVLSLDDFPDELLGQLLEWSPTVIATPLTAEQINAFGIKIDIVIAAAEGEAVQSDVKLLPPGSDAPLMAALKYLVANQYQAVNIITGLVDTTLLADFSDRINPVIFAKELKIYPVRSGFTKWKPAGGFFRILTPHSGLTVTGFTQQEDGLLITNSDGFVTFTFNDTLLFVAEDI